ncbi:hypothetical protein [Mesorhizobium sangaii]|uniref:Uncharacterized protein n=1 Tax=Mesorhizobium sangaii TaxID=505389 RepID=A0A841P9W2_9HYPH|nr:hypothetical protein [Mesorhizobium sangaii]MBB6407730.1 hypothetical protein [Mesorhizobium sangaii]
MIATAIFRRQKPFSHGLDLAERVIRGKGPADVPGLLQHETAGQRMSTNISLLHQASMAKRDDIRQPALHYKFTGLRKDGGIEFAFHRDFRPLCRDTPFSRPVRHGMVMAQRIEK